MMAIPPYLDELLSADLEPGECYRACVEALRVHQQPPDYALTAAIATTVEIRLAAQALAAQNEEWHNFGDLAGDSDARLFAALDSTSPARVVFVGAGAFPVTAGLLARRYPGATVTCVDNDLRAYWLGRTVLGVRFPAAHYLYEEGTNVDFAAYDAVVVAAMVRGKLDVVERALRLCPGPVVVKGQVPLAHPRLTVIEADFDCEGRLLVTEERNGSPPNAAAVRARYTEED